MAKSKRTTLQILEAVQKTMDTAEIGYDIFVNGSPARKLAGLMNLVTFGVSVTCVLQNLRHIEPDFDSWYEKYRAEMIADPLMKYFWNFRSEILKEGKLEIGAYGHIKHLTSADFSRFEPPPPDAIGFFMCDQIGGSGYEIRQPDGSVEKYYINIPSDIMSISLHFPSPPKSHMGKELPNRSIESLSRLYLDYLQQMAKDAKEKFKPKEKS